MSVEQFRKDWGFLAQKREPETQVIFVSETPLTEKQIATAFAGCAKTQWYKALVQLMNGVMQENLLNASRAASSNNALAAAGGLNVYEAFSALLFELDKLVNQERVQ